MNGKIDEEVKLRGLRGSEEEECRVRVRVTSGYGLVLECLVILRMSDP